jgi:hypothetical protein
MQFALLIWKKWDDDDDLSREVFARYGEFGQAAAEAGVLRGGTALRPAVATTTVRVRDDQLLLSDGPYLESKEHLSGFYLIECDTLDEAAEWASRIPDAKTGAVEICPLMSLD